MNALDPWNPNNWDTMFAAEDSREVVLYLDDDGRDLVLISAIDYQWATSWRWCAKRDPNGNIYARRAVGENAFGSRLRTFTLYLHIEIMKRMKRRKPTPRHKLVDHRDGNSCNNQRRNLRWATHSMNNWNRGGARSVDLIEG